MTSTARAGTALRLALPLAFLTAALATPAAQADERCTGTLCDLYYGGPPSEQPATATPQPAPKPLIVPGTGMLGRLFGTAGPAPANGTAQPATRPMIGVGGGGLAAMARGAPAERCTGTLCDLYYGGPPPETPAAGQPAPMPATETAVEQPADEAAAAGPAPRLRENVETQHCAAAVGRDPWSCYR